MTSLSDLSAVRRAFARQIVHKAKSRDPRLEAAFAAIPRESFLDPGPWALMQLDAGYQPTPDADPAFLYQDVPVSIFADKRLNNGQPSFLAMLIDLCAIREGDRVVHIGTGTGYYTAVLARLAGPTGRVLGIEYEASLAARAAANLAANPNAAIVHADGWQFPLAPADAILVNAGTPRLSATWLDALAPGGRLVLPLTTSVDHDGRPMGRGVIFRIERDEDGFAAAGTYGTMIYPCIGAEDAAAEAALTAAFERGDVGKVRRLRREPVADASRCWLKGEGWALTFD